MQLHPDNKSGFLPELVVRMLQELGVIGLNDWDDGTDSVLQFREGMNVGDIVAIKSGSAPIALVEVLSEPFIEENTTDTFDWFEIRRRVRILDIYSPGLPDYNFHFVQPRGTISRCRDLNNQTSQLILNWYRMSIDNALRDEIIQLLNYKKQVILQGPPGTGKTRMAKMVANELASATAEEDALGRIEGFFKGFTASATQLARREKLNGLLASFHKEFPSESLSGLNLENYPIGRGENDSFCWWIERGLKELGYYFPGSARSYKLFWKKDEEKYSIHGKDFKDEEPEEVVKEIGKALNSLVTNEVITEASNYFSDSFLLKVLHSYYPEKYFPINSVKCLDNTLHLFGEDSKELNSLEKNKSVLDFFYEMKTKHNSEVTSYEFMSWLFASFNVKGKISFDGKKVVAEGEVRIVQFHPSYTYEDFVRGITVRANEGGGISYQSEDKLLASLAKTAMDNPSSKVVLIIDEINRANLSSVLGELIYALEYRYEHGSDNEQGVGSIYADEANDKTLTLPDNLLIIGTMNTADRSVGHLDYAIRRRFAFKDILPNEAVVTDPNAKTLFNKVQRLFTPEFLSPDFDSNNVSIGHSYFLAKDSVELRLKLEYEVKPILREYISDGLLNDNAKEHVESLSL